MKKSHILITLSLTAVLGLACEKVMPGAPGDDEILDGPVEGLTHEQNLRFLRGDVAFNDEVFTSQTGLGPLFVATSCGSCHAGDGKGHPFTTLTRFGQTDSTGNKFLPFGPQLQHRALPGHAPEEIPTGATSSRFTPPANTGLGYLAALTDAQILSHADPNDADGDGVSGVPNYIHPPTYFKPLAIHTALNGLYIGRFGKKAGAIDLLQQTVNAYNEDIGIASTYNPYDTYSHAEIDPEISNQVVQDVVFYLRTLKAPVQRNPNSADVIAGKQVFATIGCGKCHTPEWTTGPNDIAALANKTFYPYTDLLMHDMGPELNDGYTEGTASTSEWKTPALWGIGLSRNSQGGRYYLMHDGRANSIADAILLHGGEGQQSRSAFQSLPEKEKQQLITFLESL